MNKEKKPANIKTNHIEVIKTARYASFGNLSEKTKYFWIALHGSNMLCEQVIYKFSDFDPETHFVIAPEALSRFYKDGGYGGDVVAAWMTKRDRLHEIQDIANYLSKLFTSYDDLLPMDCKKCIMAFSQGGTMAFRWLHNQIVQFDHLIAYSCWIPEDIDLTKSQTPMNEKNLLFTYGVKDAFLTEETMAKVEAVIRKNKLSIELMPYEGIHRIDRNQLKQIFNQKIK